MTFVIRKADFIALQIQIYCGGRKMIALEGVYEDGVVRLLEKRPMEKARVLVIFQESIEERNNTDIDSDMELFHQFSRSISEPIDEKAELMEALNEKYKNIG